MPSNLDRYKKDLDSLIDKGGDLQNAIQMECNPDLFQKEVAAQLGKDAERFLQCVPAFRKLYQEWYSEAKSLVKQLLPDRLADFVSYYEKPKGRKELSHGNYTIEDYLQGSTVRRGGIGEVIVGPSAAIPQFTQQYAIVKSARARFESSLFDIRQLVRADLFDSELDAAKELSKHKFARAAGALAGVVLEKHLAQVCVNHNVKVTKKEPSISELNDALKSASAIDIPQWRFVQHLADIRNLCDHNKTADPTPEQALDLIDGVAKVTKTYF